MLPRLLTFICCALLARMASAQPDGWIPIVVDTAVVALAKECITEVDTSTYDAAGGMLYLNRIDGESNKGGKIQFTPVAMRLMLLPFNSCYSWSADTLLIDGGVGLLGGAGFSARVQHEKALVRHLEDAGEPSLAYTATDKLRQRLDVPCTGTHLVLDHIPDTAYAGPIWGYVQFQSEPFLLGGRRPSPCSGGCADAAVFPQCALPLTMLCTMPVTSVWAWGCFRSTVLSRLVPGGGGILTNLEHLGPGPQGRLRQTRRRFGSRLRGLKDWKDTLRGS